MFRPPLWADAGWRAVAAIFIFNGLLFGVWASRVPAFKLRFDLDPATLGVLLLVLAGGAIVSFPLAGWATERWGAERFSLRCALGYAPALALIALAPSVVAMAAALFLFGMVYGAMDVAMNGWAAQAERRMDRVTMSIFHALWSLGAMIGAASGFYAVQAGFGPEVHFAVVALMAAAVCLPVIGLGMGHETVDHSATGGGAVFALPSGGLLLVGLIAFSASVGEGAMADWSAVFLTTVTGTSEAQAALGYASFSLMMVATRLAGGWLVARFGPAAVTRACGATGAVGLGLVVLAPGLSLALVGFGLVGIGYAVMVPLAFSRAANDPVMRPGPALASVATLGYGGMLLGPPVVGFVAQASSLSVAFLALAGLALVPVLLGGRVADRS